MEKYYKVVFVYPDTHVEEIEEQFKTGTEALEYGNGLITQVKNTEGTFKGTEVDEFGFKEKIEPYFMILEIKGKKYRLVFDSRSR